MGAGAFLGGGTRQALSAAVIMMEVRIDGVLLHAAYCSDTHRCGAQTTGDLNGLLPLMLGIAIAKCVLLAMHALA